MTSPAGAPGVLPMTADRRLQVGGWAALASAILGPLQVAGLFLAARDPDPFAAPAVQVIEVARIVAILLAAIGLDGLFRSIAPSPARTVAGFGVGGAAILLIDAGLGVAGIRLGAIDTIVVLAGTVLIGLWFIGGGAILMTAGRGLARVGWPAQLGGLGTIATALAISIPFAGRVGVGMSWLDWFLLLGLFVVVYLVRIWFYVVGGRLPGPGIL